MKARQPIVKSFSVLMQAAKPYKLSMFCAIAGLVVTRLAEGGIYKYLIPQTLDQGFIAHKAEFFHQMPLLFIGIFVAIGIGEFLSKYCMGHVGRSVVRDYRQQMLNHLLLVPTAYFKHNTIGELISKINYDTEQVALAVSESVRECLNSIVAIIVLFGVMLSISWKVTITIMFIAPVVSIVMRALGKRMRRYSARVQQTMADLTHVSAEVISGQQVIKVYQGGAYEKKRIHAATETNRTQELRTLFIAALSAPIMQFIGGIVLVGFIYLVTSEKIDLPPGEIFGLIGVLFALIRPLKQITGVNNILQKGLAGVDSIHKLLQTPAEFDAGVTQIATRAQQLRFENVCFAYPDQPDALVLKNISFKVDSGEVVALVGGSGGGKSSLVGLVPRFYAPTRGHILIDGQDISSLQLSNLRSQIALITQQVLLFNDTIANNIAYGIKNPNLSAIRKAAEIAHALEFIEQLPQGFDTMIGENGCMLSGGQRQRIAIARAIFKDAPILILDEATSALDNESEAAIKDALQHLIQDRITLIIAHRLTTIERADKIIVLDNGRIVETGTHAQLLAQQGRYAQLQQVD